jgi:hypothetical protein
VEDTKSNREQSSSTGSGTLPKHLYHGTTTTKLGSILRRGLQPRGNQRRGNWEEYPSRPDMVYLTTAYAPYFALNAAEDGAKALIVEVDTDRLDPGLLYPDEDFVAQCLAYQERRMLREAHDEVLADMEVYRRFYLESVDGMGNVAYRGVVSPQAITRYAIIDPQLQADLMWIALDPCISVVNYRFCGNKYRSIIAWLFGDRPDFEAGVGLPVEAMEQMWPDHAAHLRKLWKSRDGISVITKGEQA